MPKGTVWKQAKSERNWMLFALLEPDKTGKVGKFPVERHNMYRPVGWQKSAVLTFDEAAEAVRGRREKGFERLNEMVDPKKYGRIINVVVGYVAREGSAMVVVDLDGCVEDGEITVDWISDYVTMTDTYVEVSVSGNGLRVLMPRADGDELLTHAEFGGVGVFGRGGKGATLQLKADRPFGGDEVVRDQDFFDECVRRRDKGRKVRKSEIAAGVSVEDQVLHHGIMSVDEFKELVGRVENKGIDFNQWYGLVLAARDYFEVVDPDRLDDVLDILDEWTAQWSEGDHDPERLRDDVWHRNPKDDRRDCAGLGSWFFMAKKADEKDEVSAAVSDGVEPPRVCRSSGDIVARYVKVGEGYYDVLAQKEVTLTAVYRHTINVPLRTNKGKLIGNQQAPRQAWINENTRSYVDFDYAPGKGQELERVDGVRFNLWRKPGALHPKGVDVGFWVDHWRYMYGDDSEVVMDAMAHMVQRSHSKVGYIVVLQSDAQGIGKDMAMLPLLRYMGKDANGGVPFEELFSDFNQWAYRKTLAVVQEARGGIDRKRAQELTEKLKIYAVGLPETIMVNRKGKPQEEIPNVVNVFMMTNNKDALHIPMGDRRFFIAASSVEPRGEEYYSRLKRLVDEAQDDIIAWLMARDIKWAGEDKKPPMTEGKEVMRDMSLPPIFEWVENYAADRDWVSTSLIPFDMDAGIPKNPRLKGMWIGQCLEHMGFVRVGYDETTDKQKRIPVNGVRHTIYVKRECEADWDEIRDGLKRMTN